MKKKAWCKSLKSWVTLCDLDMSKEQKETNVAEGQWSGRECWLTRFKGPARTCRNPRCRGKLLELRNMSGALNEQLSYINPINYIYQSISFSCHLLQSLGSDFCLFVFCPMKLQEAALWKPGNKPSPDTGSTYPLTMDFSTSKTVRNKVWCLSHAQSMTYLLWQPERTKALLHTWHILCSILCPFSFSPALLALPSSDLCYLFDKSLQKKFFW